MNKINFKLDGIDVEASSDETILSVARRVGLYIPTMCYLKKTTPSASCRLCVVEVEGVDGMILSCQAKPTQDISVTTNSEALIKERTNIMKLYSVNHPLECGVCDKSGECDLQNKTAEFGIDQQSFSAKDQYREVKEWGLLGYNPSLCIMCEKCTHVCNEIIGDDAIEIEYGGYSSTITPKGSDTLDCTFCGECIAVCPVGALTSSDFHYRANSWELTKVPSTCPHCSAGCALEYEVKNSHGGEKIYRVVNDYEHTTLCGAGRFGFDYIADGSKDEMKLQSAVDAIKGAKAIRFSSQISNEEALMLQKIKEQQGLKLFNEDARVYSKFTTPFSSLATREDVKSSDAILILGSRISSDNPAIRYAITEASRHRGASVVNLHPIEDALMQNVITQFVKYEAGSEEGVMALLVQRLVCDVDDATKRYLDSLDDGYLSAESNFGEDELDEIAAMLSRKESRVIILGADLLSHPRAENIAVLASLLQRYAGFKVLVVASQINTVGVSLICDLDLDDKSIDGTVGYGMPAEFTISYDDSADLQVAPLSQQEGTVVTLDHQLLPLNVAVEFNGYVLNDIANILGIGKRDTVDFTSELPQSAGFKSTAFDLLENFYQHDGLDTRGYFIDQTESGANSTLEDIEDLAEFNGTVIYRCDEVLQFNALTAKCAALGADSALVGSAQFAVAARVSDGDLITITSAGTDRVREFKLDNTLKGTIALEPMVDREPLSLLGRYRYEKVTITKGSCDE